MSQTYYDLGSYNRPVATRSADAQLWFDRGLLWAYSFNHEEAENCFVKASEFDSTCVMAYWGVAYACGPNYNKAWIRFDQADMQRTFQKASVALQRARELAFQATPVEAALAAALVARFPQDGEPEDLGSLDHAYAYAMRTVYESFPNDLDVAVLFAEALMCISPRALWNLETGEPSGSNTTEARAVLEKAANSPGGHSHPAVCHLYIHLMEMSSFPEIAQPAADQLRKLVPDGSHMLHMPTHIDVACGDYRRAVDSNQDAMAADDKYFACEKGSILYNMYRAHNIYAKIYSALMSGQSKKALYAAKRLPDVLTTELLSVTSPPMADWAESYLGVLAHVLIRFGRWSDILSLGIPDNKELYCSTTAMFLYARGIAFAVLGRLDEAKVEQAKFEESRAAVPKSRLNSMPAVEVDVLQIASAMLQGEIAYRMSDFPVAFDSLRAATAFEDALPYADTPPWMQPARHALGALLLERDQVEQAEIVYREDLGLGDNLPRRKARLNNVWGLHGLYECLIRGGKFKEARLIQLQRDIALATADVPIVASCFCRLSAVEAEMNCPKAT